MRGTGCSGGAFDYFEPLQGLDGYDVVETVARQPWVAHHKVGMMGISYGGISQLFVAATRPPSLAAIAPLSVIDDTATTLYPGGILNTGFALSWAKDRVHDAKPASATGGQAWALKRIRGGDRTCKANQALHAEAVDLLAKMRANRYYVPKVADPLAPVRSCTRSASRSTSPASGPTSRRAGTARRSRRASPAPRASGSRSPTARTSTRSTRPRSSAGTTSSSSTSRTAGRSSRPRVRGAAPVIFSSAMGVPGVTLPDDPIQAQPTYGAARAAFEALPPVRILFDNGAGSRRRVLPSPASSSPSRASRCRGRTRAPGTSLPAGRSPTPRRPRRASTRSPGTGRPGRRRTSPATRPPARTACGRRRPRTTGRRARAGTALAYVTAPLTADTAVVGAGALDAWISSSARSVDLQVTVSEVRPDGQETFVQSGWLRASARKLDARRSTLLEPVLSLRRKDAAPLPKGRWAKVTVPLYYQGHVYRAGSRAARHARRAAGRPARVGFGELQPRGRASVSVSRAPSRPSRLILPVVAGLDVPTGLPPVPGAARRALPAL